MTNTTSRIVLSVILSLMLLSIIISSVFLYKYYKEQSINKKKSNYNITNTFPLTADEETSFIYFLECQIQSINNENTLFRFGTDKFEYINLKLTANCSYTDIDNKQQEVLIPLGAIIENKDGFFFSYLNRSFSAFPISMPQKTTGDILKERIDNYLTEYYGETIKLQKGDNVSVFLVKGFNDMAQINTEQPNGTSDYIYYGSGFTKSWDPKKFEKFIQTGYKEELPSLEDGRRIIPALRVKYIKTRQ